jgi:hypothetical protein
MLLKQCIQMQPSQQLHLMQNMTRWIMMPSCHQEGTNRYRWQPSGTRMIPEQLIDLPLVQSR